MTTAQVLPVNNLSPCPHIPVIPVHKQFLTSCMSGYLFTPRAFTEHTPLVTCSHPQPLLNTHLYYLFTPTASPEHTPLPTCSHPEPLLNKAPNHTPLATCQYCWAQKLPPGLYSLQICVHTQTHQHPHTEGMLSRSPWTGTSSCELGPSH